MFHLTHNENKMLMHKNSMNIFSKCEPCHEHKRDPQDIPQHKSYFKVLYNAYALILMNNSMGIYNMVTLSMERRK